MTEQHTRREMLAVTGSTLLFAGCASESTPEEEQSPSEIVNAWLDEHESTEQNAVDQYSAGNEAFDAGDYSRALTHFERATESYESLEEAVDSAIENYENGSKTWELFSMLGQYYAFIRRASTWRYSAAHERAVNDDPVASQKALETSNDRFERAEELKADFRERLNSETPS